MKIMFSEDAGCGPYVHRAWGVLSCKADDHCMACYDWLNTHPGEILNKPRSPSDPINPPHYTAGGIEAIDVIEKWNLNRNLAQAVAYVLRCEHKGNKNHDLEKAIDYLHRERYGSWATLPERTKK